MVRSPPQADSGWVTPGDVWLGDHQRLGHKRPSPAGRSGLARERRPDDTTDRIVAVVLQSSHMEVASRELRNNTRQVLERVASGEHVHITVNGKRQAVLMPEPGRRTWMGRGELVRLLSGAQADSDLGRDLDELAGDTTDDLAW